MESVRDTVEQKKLSRVVWAVYPGSEKLALGPKQAACLCKSKPQADHMASFWGPHGYVEPFVLPLSTDEIFGEPVPGT